MCAHFCGKTDKNIASDELPAGPQDSTEYILGYFGICSKYCLVLLVPFLVFISCSKLLNIFFLIFFYLKCLTMFLSNKHNETIIVDIGGVYSLTHSLCYFALSVVGVVVFPGSLRVSDSRM